MKCTGSKDFKEAKREINAVLVGGERSVKKGMRVKNRTEKKSSGRINEIRIEQRVKKEEQWEERAYDQIFTTQK